MAEVKRAWEAAELLGYPFGGFARMLMLTGQRRSEVAAIQWDDVDFAGATWTLAAHDNKSERAHLVPLSAPALSILAAAPRLGDYVFTTDGRTPISGFAKAKARLDGFLSAKGGELAPWRFHDLRRTMATHMVR